MKASKSPLQRYTSCLIYAGVALAILSSLGLWFWGGARVHKLWFILLLFMATVQWLVFAFTAKFAQHKTQTMLRQYQIAKYAKLFIYLIVLAVYVFAVKTNAIAFLTNFIVYYLVFTVLEVWFFHRWLNSLPQTK
jgi:hypothetical protein